ncbi:MAG: nucleotide exchange factor GrpE [Candidatus Diapherotrites archaeon]
MDILLVVIRMLETKPSQKKENPLPASAPESADLLSTLQRVQADFENYRKRSEGEMLHQYQRGKAAAFKELLSFADALDAAAEKVGDEHKKGFENLRFQFQKILATDGVKPMNVLGKTFDPFTSECIMQEFQPNQKEDIVMDEIQRGYLFHNDVLRTAKVKINKHNTTENETTSPLTGNHKGETHHE